MDYYSSWTRYKKVDNLFSDYLKNNKLEFLLGIEASAWNLNLCLILNNRKMYIQYNYPHNCELIPHKISKENLVTLGNILSSKLFQKIKNLKGEIVFCRGPGFLPCLKVSNMLVPFFKESIFFSVLHGQSHLREVIFEKKVNYPATGVYFSGGNTCFLELRENEEIMTFSETIDITIGNLLDRISKHKGKRHPWEIPLDKNKIVYKKKYTKYFKNNYFNLSGIYDLLKNEDYEETYSFILTLLLDKIRTRKEKPVIFFGGVFNSKVIKEKLSKSIPNSFFITSNSDKGYMHIINHLTKGSRKENPPLYFEPLEKMSRDNLFSNDVDFSSIVKLGKKEHSQLLNGFAELPSPEKRKFLTYINLKNNRFLKFKEIINYRRYSSIQFIKRKVF